MHIFTRPRFGRLASGLLILGLVTTAEARADTTTPPRYTRYSFTPLARDGDASLELDHLDVFVVVGRPREPAFLRAKSRAWLGEAWVDLEPGEQELKYYEVDEYARVQEAIEGQVHYFENLVGVHAPPGPRVAIAPDAVIAGSWFENMERASRQTQRPGPNVFVVNEVSLVSSREDFVRAMNPRPVHVRLRLLLWDSRRPDRFERLERVIPGHVRPAALGPDDRLAIDLHRAVPTCARGLLN